MTTPLKAITVPDVPAPNGVCWVRDTRIPGNFVGAHCTFKKRHRGRHEWAVKNPTCVACSRPYTAHTFTDRYGCPGCFHPSDLIAAGLPKTTEPRW